MAERIGTERGRSMLRVLEESLFGRPGPDCFLERGPYILDVKIQVHGRPVPLVAPDVPRIRRGFALLALLEQRDRRVAGLQDGDARIGLGHLGKSESLRVE